MRHHRRSPEARRRIASRRPGSPRPGPRSTISPRRDAAALARLDAVRAALDAADGLMGAAARRQRARHRPDRGPGGRARPEPSRPPRPRPRPRSAAAAAAGGCGPTAHRRAGRRGARGAHCAPGPRWPSSTRRNARLRPALAARRPSGRPCSARAPGGSPRRCGAASASAAAGSRRRSPEPET